jgi:hypothetical protein
MKKTAVGLTYGDQQSACERDREANAECPWQCGDHLSDDGKGDQRRPERVQVQYTRDDDGAALPETESEQQNTDHADCKQQREFRDVSGLRQQGLKILTCLPDQKA